jgi:hypothetical protein
MEQNGLDINLTGLVGVRCVALSHTIPETWESSGTAPARLAVSRAGLVSSASPAILHSQAALLNAT